MTAAQNWADALASWAIPKEILDQAPTSPWIHPVAQFTPPEVIPDSPSHQRAREAMPEGGTVLDVGSGGGRASMALTPPAAHIIAVDTQSAMLDVAEREALSRGATFEAVLGGWPEVATDTPDADVVVCHHVVFNVADITPFLITLSSHARRRVVVELPYLHPLTHLNPLWEKFWGITRPTSPTAHDLLDCAREAGIDAQLEVWVDTAWGARVGLPMEQRVEMARTRLCLPADRDDEVAAAIAEFGESTNREVATLWWDV